ncbi:MAG: hypothetical protein JXB32_11460 [Deltaproteobacteria bacterium]|nr:hypothetical protein [Deltaproteobacteria bacterium]
MTKLHGGMAAATALIATWLGMGTAQAQVTDEQVADDLVSDDQPASEISEDGLKWKIGPSFSLSFNDNRNVVGQPDGWALNFDLGLPMSLGYRTGAHELRAAFDAQIAYSRTPAIDDFIKSKDVFGFDADYLYHALEWIGPYVRFAVDTTMLHGYDERAGETTWSITRADGTVDTALGRRLLLNDPFQPLTLTEMAGAFVHPYTSESFTFEARTGFGGLHTLADDQLAVADDDATPEVEVKTLHSFDQAAVEMGLALYGAFYENKITWRIAGDVAIPVVNRPETPDHNIAYYTNVDLSATLSFKLLEWLSVDYAFKALRRPQLIDEFQITNNLLLTLSYTWSDENTGDAAAAE